MAELPDDVELGIACDALKDRGLDAMAGLFAGLVVAERSRAEGRSMDAGRTVDQWLGSTFDGAPRVRGPFRAAMEAWAFDPAPKLDMLRVETVYDVGRARTILSMSVYRSGVRFASQRAISDLDGRDDEAAYLRQEIESCHLGLIGELRKRPRLPTARGTGGTVTVGGVSIPVAEWTRPAVQLRPFVSEMIDRATERLISQLGVPGRLLGPRDPGSEGPESGVR